MSKPMARIEEEKHYVGFDYLLQNIKISLNDSIKISFGKSDNYVNTLIMADFNLFLRAIQGDTHRFESKKRFIEVRKKHLRGF